MATVSTEKPELLLSLLTSYIPFSQGLDVSLDGTATSLKSDSLPIDLSLAVQGKHIVLFTGSQSEEAAKLLKNVAFSASGLSAMNLDYQGFGDALDIHYKKVWTWDTDQFEIYRNYQLKSSLTTLNSEYIYNSVYLQMLLYLTEQPSKKRELDY